MRQGGGRSKGQGFERKISKEFSDWWGEENSFVRSPGSGAWGKLSKFSGSKPSADIVTPDDFPWSIECKKDQSVEIHHLLINPEGCSVAVWLKKLVEEDCVISKKKPMLIFSKNNWKSYCMLGKDDYDTLLINVIHFIWKKRWVLFLLDDFFKNLKKIDVSLKL